MQQENFSDADCIAYLKEKGLLNDVYEGMQTEMRKKYLEMHPNEIWQDESGNYCTYFPDATAKEGRVRRKSKDRKKLEDKIVDFWRDKEDFISVQDVFNEWNDRKLRLGLNIPSTHDRNIRTFNRHFSEFGKRNIKEVTPLEVNDFLEEEVGNHNLKASAFARLKTVVKGMFKRAKKRGLIDFSIDQVLSDLDISKSQFDQEKKSDESQIFKEEELKKLSSYLKEHLDIWNLGIMLILVTGLRVGELVTLKWSDFTDNTYKYFKVQRTETTYKGADGKTVYDVKPPKTEAGYRTVTVPDECTWILKALRKINPFGEYIFMRNEKRMTTNTIRCRLYRVCDKLGLKRKSPHKGRKTYATILLDCGADNAFVIAQLGHTDISCTEDYYHKDRKSNETKSAIVNSISEFKYFSEEIS